MLMISFPPLFLALERDIKRDQERQRKKKSLDVFSWMKILVPHLTIILFSFKMYAFPLVHFK